MNTQTFILPAFWASALINNDYSGLEDNDEKELNDWLTKVKPGYCVGCSDEPYFTHSNDAMSLGCDVLEFYFPES